MLDFLKIIYWNKLNVENYILNKVNFPELKCTLEIHTEFKSYPYFANHENLSIIVNDKTVVIKNSLHMLNNLLKGEKKDNHNDFRFSELVNILNTLIEKFPDIQFANISQLEFGLNIEVPIEAEKIINHNVISHAYHSANYNSKFEGLGCLKLFEKSNYYIKIYDKGKQYKLKEHKLRFEVKFIKKIELNKLGVRGIEDLKSQVVLVKLFKYLIKRFDEMIIVDSIYDKQIPRKDKKELQTYLSENFWIEQSKRINRNKKAYYKRRFKQLLNKHELLTLKNSLRALLVEKFNQLINQ